MDRLTYEQRSGLITNAHKESESPMSNIRVDNNTKQPKQHMAEVFGGDANAGTIPVHRSTMEAEPVIYTGAFLDAATEVELTEMISEDFKARGVHQHRVRITDGRMVGEHIVIFDDAYEHCVWMPDRKSTRLNS